jgi:hypothetical protein
LPTNTGRALQCSLGGDHTLYGLDANDAVTAPVDLRKPVEEAVVARFPRWGKGELKDHALRAAQGSRFNKDGTLLLRVMVYTPSRILSLSST